MKKFAFVPVGMTMVPEPGHRAVEGTQPKRLCMTVKEDRWVSRAQPHVVDAVSREALLLRRMASRGDVIPHDAETAAGCGLRFRPVEWLGPDEGWAFATARASAPKADKPSRSGSRTRPDSSSSNKDS
jgi:hypothetical protein